MRTIRAVVLATVLAAFTMMPGVSSTSSNLNQEAYAGCSITDCIYAGCSAGMVDGCTLLTCDDGAYRVCYYRYDVE